MHAKLLLFTVVLLLGLARCDDSASDSDDDDDHLKQALITNNNATNSKWKAWLKANKRITAAGFGLGFLLGALAMLVTCVLLWLLNLKATSAPLRNVTTAVQEPDTVYDWIAFLDVHLPTLTIAVIGVFTGLTLLLFYVTHYLSSGNRRALETTIAEHLSSRYDGRKRRGQDGSHSKSNPLFHRTVLSSALSPVAAISKAPATQPPSTPLNLASGKQPTVHNGLLPVLVDRAESKDPSRSNQVKVNVVEQTKTV